MCSGAGVLVGVGAVVLLGPVGVAVGAVVAGGVGGGAVGAGVGYVAENRNTLEF